jgi:4-aminobutyrate aminotransferase
MRCKLASGARAHDRWDAGAHGNTYGGNPVCAAAALATLRLVEEEGMLENAAHMGNYIQAQVRDMKKCHPTIGDVRGKGLMVGVELVTDRGSKEPAKQIVSDLLQIAFERGLLLLPCGVSTIRFMPPLNVSQELVDEGLFIFDQALSEAENNHFNGRNGR